MVWARQRMCEMLEGEGYKAIVGHTVNASHAGGARGVSGHRERGMHGKGCIS